MSIVVIGLNHRTVPLELLERTTVTAAALPKALHDLISATEHQRGRAALDVQPHRGLRRRRALPSGVRRHPRLPVRPRPHGARGSAAAPLQPARRGRRRPPVLGGGGAGVGRARRARDPGAGAQRLVGGAVRRHRPLVAEPAVPPRARDRQAGPHRDRHRPVHGVGRPTPRWRWRPSASARWPVRVCSWSAPGRWAKAS